MASWRVRFSRLRLDGLNDEHRSGRPRSITDEQVQTVVNQVLLQSKPEDASHWSTRSMSQSGGRHFSSQRHADMACLRP
jgi:transposase